MKITGLFRSAKCQKMALLDVVLNDSGLMVMHRNKPEVYINIPYLFTAKEASVCTVWDDECLAEFVDPVIDEWFTKILETNCRLVYMPVTARRQVDQRYARPDHITSFADAFPIMMIGQASLNDISGKVDKHFSANRFRPNIVFNGGEAFQEDRMLHFKIGKINFYGVKPCARCPIVNINQETGVVEKEPLKTLSGYRKKDHKVYFGQNVIHEGEGFINLNDELKIEKMATENFI